MAKTKRTKGKTKVQAQVQRSRPANLHIRSSEEWKAWVEELAEFNRSPSVADMIDDAVVLLAREIKFTKGPPKR